MAFRLIRCEVLLFANLIRQLTQSIKQSPTTWSKCSKITANVLGVRYTKLTKKHRNFITLWQDFQHLGTSRCKGLTLFHILKCTINNCFHVIICSSFENHENTTPSRLYVTHFGFYHLRLKAE